MTKYKTLWCFRCDGEIDGGATLTPAPNRPGDRASFVKYKCPICGTTPHIPAVGLDVTAERTAEKIAELMRLRAAVVAEANKFIANGGSLRDWREKKKRQPKEKKARRERKERKAVKADDGKAH